jgi:membrane-bound serine protease (ClpP class)
MSGRERFFHTLADPNVAYVLFLIGIYGLIYELASPGAVLPGVAGVIGVVLALLSYGSFSVSFAGVALILLAIVLFILEMKTPGYGALAVGGIISLFIGSLLMFSPMVPYFRISLTVVITMSILSICFFGLIIYIGISGLKGKVESGIKSLIDSEGEVKVKIDPVGIVFLNKEDWSAVSFDGKPIDKGFKVKVLEVQGVKLVVQTIEKK